MSTEAIKAAADAASEQLLKIVSEGEDNGWAHHSTARGVRIERNKSTPLHRWRATGTIGAGLAEVVKAASRTGV